MRENGYLFTSNEKQTVARRIKTILIIALPLLAVSTAVGELRFPPPDFETGYEMPHMTRPLARAQWQETMDVAVLAGALSVGAYLALWRRSRTGMLGLTIFSLAYFGFYRGGCVCPIGAIQNVSLAVADSSYVLPFTVALFFVLPLAFAALFGRVFCAGVCPLGAMQELVLVKPVKVPDWLEEGLGVLPLLYVGVAVLYAVTDTAFVICRFDPFVSFFRLNGRFLILVGGGIVLGISTFVGRPYCRFLCPYAPLLAVISRFAWKRASITPHECVGCTLCDDACPYGAIERPTPEKVSPSL